MEDLWCSSALTQTFKTFSEEEAREKLQSSVVLEEEFVLLNGLKRSWTL